MVQSNQFFDLWGVFQNEVFGDPTLFILGILIVIAIITLKNRMPFQVSIGLVVIWLAIASQGAGFWWFMIITGLSILFTVVMTRFFRRG